MLSVVVATQDSERLLLPTFVALVPGAIAGVVSEVIVVDRSSRDDTLAIADAAGCRLIQLDLPLAARLKAGADAARERWLLFLRPGIELETGWIDEISRFIEAANEAGAAVLRRAEIGGKGSFLSEAMALLRQALSRPPTPDQGLLIAKSFYDQMGGHRDGPDPETDLLRRIGRGRTLLLRSAAIPAAAIGQAGHVR
jgi:glycosyltransferase involved in cell wall biosynthesis